MYTKAVRELIGALCKLPGVGEKSAERIAYHILTMPDHEVHRLTEAIGALKNSTRACTICYNISEKSPCDICSQATRDREVICVVELVRDLWAIEKMGLYRGLFHVLNGRLSPLEGIGPDELTINGLIQRVRRDNVREVILATSTTMEGEATAHHIHGLLKGLGVRVTRLACGLPAGSTLQYSSRATLSEAFLRRYEFGS
jgi:recombination protein RecR